MVWVVLGFDWQSDVLLEVHRLPADFTVAAAARLVGDHPDLIGADFELSPEQLDELRQVHGVGAVAGRCAYFLEAQASGPAA